MGYGMAEINLYRNPHNTSEVWHTDYMFRRHITPSEYAWWVGTLGYPVYDLPSQWFDSIPVATG